ncbi:MAG: TetR/AcrR family transcriptional regulator [Oscillospiraceae bacterium]|nr:TetR/AcrR family transcriptional regulator [Oscillospiraceae bacterium]
MPPRVRITEEMIVGAATEIIREKGLEKLNARAVAEKLGCSTQPVLYCFATMEELKRAAYARADRIHTEYLMDTGPDCDPVLGMGLNYIRFAVEEPRLFRFLFQSGYAAENSITEMLDSKELEPVLAAMQESLGMDMQKTGEVFLTVALFTHGYASIIANNGMEFDECLAATHLERAFTGAVLAVGQEDVE